MVAAENKIRKYEPMLYRIATSFGFSKNESLELVQQACMLAYKSYAKQEISCPLKIFVAKGLVHKCVFKVSSQLFSQSTTTRTYTFNSLYTGDICLQEMPISLKVVYLLNIQFKFNEIEIAEILNTTQVQVKEKLHRALMFMKTH